MRNGFVMAEKIRRPVFSITKNGCIGFSALPCGFRDNEFNFGGLLGGVLRCIICHAHTAFTSTTITRASGGQISSNL